MIQDEYPVEAFDTRRGNMIGWFQTEAEAEAFIERRLPDPTGVVIWKGVEVVKEYHGPLVTP